ERRRRRRANRPPARGRPPGRPDPPGGEGPPGDSPRPAAGSPAGGVRRERAKQRAANGVHFDDHDDSGYAAANYRRSRRARANDYYAKWRRLGEACRLAPAAGIAWGWREDPADDIPYVVYFELPTGQVSFHSTHRGEGPDFPGEWDAQRATRPAWRPAAGCCSANPCPARTGCRGRR
ncbi:MAG: hypothetical protein K2X87_02545, partial [Gemmataceae bacterium]|nr:hypothetical protein [Gemmataceae bacterium]